MLYEIRKGTVSLGGEIILDHIDFRIKHREKVALVGRNGAGKTTLLRLISGELSPDPDDHLFHSAIETAGEIHIGMLHQEPLSTGFPPGTSLDDLLNSKDFFIRRLGLSGQRDEGGQENTEDKRPEQPGHNWPDQAGQEFSSDVLSILTRLGFQKKDLGKPIASFSGGEQIRMALALLLSAKPDLLLLDEPTNHLDAETVEWLEESLINYPGAVIMVSHDRYFLDRTAGIVYEIDQKKLFRYAGNYSAYRSERTLRMQKEQQQYKAALKERQRLEDLIRRFRHKPKKAAMTRAKRKQLERTGMPAKPRDDGIHRFIHPIEPLRKGPKLVLEARKADIGFDKNHILFRFDFSVRRGRKIGILGRNGAGKTTLLNTISGRMSSVSGSVRTSEGISAAYLGQHSAAELQTEDRDGKPLNVLTHFQMHFPLLSRKELRTTLAHYLFSGADVYKPVSKLSGGEKNRLLLAELIESRPNLLILDEPTNHMDIPARETIESAVKAFKGTVIFVTHDRYFLNSCADSLLIIEGDQLLYDPFGYDHYLSRRKKSKAGEEDTADPVSAENAALIESLHAVPKKERHQTSRFSTEQSYADWQLILAADRLKKIQDKLEDNAVLVNYRTDDSSEVPYPEEDPYPGLFEAMERQERDRQKLEEEYTEICLQWYEKWILYEDAFMHYQ